MQSMDFKKRARERVVSSLATLFAGTFLGAGVNFLLQVLLARMLGSETFGMFSASLALVSILAPLAGFGIAGFWLNIYGKEGGNAERWLSVSVKFVIVSSVLIFLTINAWAWLGPHRFEVSILLALLSFYTFGQVSVDLVSAKYQLEGNLIALAGFQAVPHIIRFVGVGGVFLFLSVNAFNVGVVFLLSSFALIVFCVFQVRMMGLGKLKANGKQETDSPVMLNETNCDMRSVFRGAWPHGVASFCYLIYFQSNVIVVKYMLGEQAAGIYSVAFIIIAAVYLVPNVIYMKLLMPRFQRWAHHDIDKLRGYYIAGRKIMFICGALVAVTIIMSSSLVIKVFFGEQYLQSANLLVVLALAIPLRFVSSATGAVLTTGENMKSKALILAVAGVANIFILIALVAHFGLIGAAVSTVIVELILLALFMYFLEKRKVLA